MGDRLNRRLRQKRTSTVTSVRTALFVIMVKLVMIEAKPACRQDNDTLSLLVTGTQNCEEHSWKTDDGTVLAYDENVNKAFVLRTGQGPGHYNITFRTCLPNVTFTCNKEPVSCEYTCAGQSNPIRSLDKCSREHSAIIGSALVVFLIIIIISIRALCERAKHKEHFQAERDSSV